MRRSVFGGSANCWASTAPGLYYEPVGESEENLRLMRLLDEQYTRTPFYGSRRMTEWLADAGLRGESQAGLAADGGDGDRGRLSEAEAEPAGRRPQDLPVPVERRRRWTRVNQVWSTDITYIRMAQGFVYLVAVMDWFSRFVLSWSLSLTMEVDFCIEALKRALRRGRPEIFNSDQGSQFTSEKFTGELARRGRSPSAWTDAGAAWTTSSSSACGGR